MRNENTSCGSLGVKKVLFPDGERGMKRGFAEPKGT